MKIERYSTFYKITNPDVKGRLIVEDDLSTTDYETEEKHRYAYFYNRKMDVLRIPVGLGDKYIKKVFNVDSKDILHGYISDVQHIEDFSIKHSPYEYQRPIIELARTIHDDGGNSLFIDLPTGKGKTFTAMSIIKELKTKTIIVVKNTNLGDQWLKEIKGETDLKFYEYGMASGSASMCSLLRNNQTKIIIVTHATMRNLGKVGYDNINELLFEWGCGMKVFDEADLEVLSMFTIDLHTSINFTLYLTATTYKSNKQDNAIYKKCFKAVSVSGSEYFQGSIANRNAFVVKWKSNPGKCVFLANDFSGKFSRYKYSDYLFIYRSEAMLGIVKKVLDFFNKNKTKDDHKLVIYIAHKSYCFLLKHWLSTKLGIDNKDIGIVNSDIEEQWRNYNMSRNIIITTRQSLSRGIDLKGILCQLDLDVYWSKSEFEQQVGRTGRTGGDTGYYFGVYDLSFLEHNQSLQGKIKLYSKHFNQTKGVMLKELPTPTLKGLKEIRDNFIKTNYRFVKSKFTKKKKGGKK